MLTSYKPKNTNRDTKIIIETLKRIKIAKRNAFIQYNNSLTQEERLSKLNYFLFLSKLYTQVKNSLNYM